MKVHCLGTTGYHPSPTRHTACYYVPELSLLLDAGTGMFALTPLLLNDPRKTLDVFLSHTHLDHIVGLTFLLDTCAVTTLERVRVHGERRKLDAVREHLFSEHLFPLFPTQIEFCPLDEDKGRMELVNGATIEWFPLEHPGGCMGVRVDWRGHALAYITDTVARPNADYLHHLADVDLLMHECYFTDDHCEFAKATGHSWLSAVTDVVRQVRPKKTALIHLSPMAEILNASVTLTSEHTHLGIFIPNDGDCCQW